MSLQHEHRTFLLQAARFDMAMDQVTDLEKQFGIHDLALFTPK